MSNTCGAGTGTGLYHCRESGQDPKLFGGRWVRTEAAGQQSLAPPWPSHHEFQESHLFSEFDNGRNGVFCLLIVFFIRSGCKRCFKNIQAPPDIAKFIFSCLEATRTPQDEGNINIY